MSIHRRGLLMSSVAGLGGLAAQSRRGPQRTNIVSGKRVFVIGGPGNIGTSTLEVLLEHGNQIGLFTLPQSYSEEWSKRLKFYLADRNDSAKLKSAFDDFRPDYVVDFVLFRPDQAKEVLRIVQGKVRQYVFISTVDVNGYPAARIPQRETDPQVPTTNQYSADKKASEEVFQSAFNRDKFPLTIVRPTYSLGATVLISFVGGSGVHMIQRIREGRPVLVPGDGDGLWQPGHSRNTGRMIAWVVGQQKAIGKTYQCGQPDLITKDEYVRKIARVVGKDPLIVHVPAEVIIATNHPDVMKSRFPSQMRYHLAHSIQTFLEDYPDFRFKETVEEGIQEYIQYQEKRGGFADAGKEIIDDRIIAAWQECRKHFHL